ncbi:MAG: class I SAM-dependent methyltransferase [Flaviflexus sp.]|uniref:class I SAM-dependent methyltransferase n=1 Tax=Flaviflexus sp. TaxID=1969482 RepID=UPI003F8EF716
MDSKLIDELAELHDQASMVGWDFSRLDGRMKADEPWWDFEEDCAVAVQSAASVLDMGTGGGERLTRLLDTFGWQGSPAILATEGWEPNVPVAKEVLLPRGIEVRQYDPDNDDPMPFENDQFDLIMSRHEGMDASEIARILAPGGRYLTQQVSGFDAEELHEWFGAEYLYPEVTAKSYVAQLETAGLVVDTVDEWAGAMTFADVQALVTYIALVPWDVPGFRVADHREVLTKLAKNSPIEVTQRRFRVYAVKSQ